MWGLVNDDFNLLDEPLDPEMFTFIIEGSYIALYSAPKSGLSIRPAQSRSCRQACRQINLSARLIAQAT